MYNLKKKNIIRNINSSVVLYTFNFYYNIRIFRVQLLLNNIRIIMYNMSICQCVIVMYTYLYLYVCIMLYTRFSVIKYWKLIIIIELFIYCHLSYNPVWI